MTSYGYNDAYLAYTCNRAIGNTSSDMNNTFTSVDSTNTPHLFETVIALPLEYQSKTLSSITFSGVVGNYSSTTSYYTNCGTMIMAVSGHVVPEPGTLALLAGGLVGLLAYAWRKRK
jgi:hypothetical protein